MLSRLKNPTLNSVVGILHYISIVAMVFLFAYSLTMWLYTSSVWGLGGVFWSSWMAVAFVYLGIALFLQINGVSAAESFIICLTGTISMFWLFEILFHFSFWNSWNYGKPPYCLLSENVIFINYGLIALSALSGYRYAKTSRWFWLTILAVAVLWIFWITIGYPQYEFPQKVYTFAWPRIVINNPNALALPLNTVTKFLLGAAYVLPYLPSNQKFSKTKNDVKRFLVERGFLE